VGVFPCRGRSPQRPWSGQPVERRFKAVPVAPRSYTGLVKIMLTLMDRIDTTRTVVSSIPREMCVRPVNGTVVAWLFCVKQDGEQVETVL
jgi:hypothetical protein